MATTEITATFGPAHGDRAALSKSCRTTLGALYQHPLSHNLEWADVIALMTKLGAVEHKSNNEFVFTLDGEQRLMRKAHGKDLSADDVITFRHMLTRAGWSPESTAPQPSALQPSTATPSVALVRAPDLMAVVEHHEARIYHLDIAAADEADHVIKPYDPHHFLHHLSHKDQSRERGQRVAEDPSFYVRIAETLRPAGRIVVVGHSGGHSSAAHHLTEYLREHHKDLFDRTILFADADLSKLTPRQLLALGRKALSHQTGDSAGA